MAGPSDEEVAASEVMSGALGVPVRCSDVGSAGRWDFEFVLDDGTQGSGEMTTITDDADREWRSLRRRSPRIEGSNSQWLVRRRGEAVSFKELLRHLQVVAPLVEQSDARDFDLAIRDASLDGIEAVEWFRRRRVRVIRLHASTEHRGRVWPESDVVGAWGEWSPEDALAWVESELERDRYTQKFDKLARSGAPEQHLVLRLDVAGVPPEHLFAIEDPQMPPPSRSPNIRYRALTGLWLLPEMGRSVLWWTARSGWGRSEVR